VAKRYIEGAYARLQGLSTSTILADAYIQLSFGEDYNVILQNLRSSTDDTFDGFDLPTDCFANYSNAKEVVKDVLRSKILQLLKYLELVHMATDRIVQVGSVFNLISDQELKSRCSDLLSASDHFDRVINQATQVLEERIRTKLPDLMSDFGENLVGKAINPEPAKARIKFSDSPSEQSGYAALFRGLVGAFRNPTHHRFLEHMTREQALQICAFIDNMLVALEMATINNASV
jgi:Protein of unknown function (Hypoth_ymh)